MSFAQVVDLVYWPFTGVGLLCIFVLWKRSVQQPWLYWITGVTMVAFAPTVLLIFFLFNQTVGLLLAQDFLALALGALMIPWAVQKSR